MAMLLKTIAGVQRGIWPSA